MARSKDVVKIGRIEFDKIAIKEQFKTFGDFSNAFKGKIGHDVKDTWLQLTGKRADGRDSTRQNKKDKKEREEVQRS